MRVARPKRNVLVHAIAVAFAIPSTVFAGTIIVDGTTCTLADAILSANADSAPMGSGCASGSGRDAILMTTSAALSASLPVVTSDIDFLGDGPGMPPTAVEISGNGTFRFFWIGDETHTPTVTFSKLIMLAGGVAGGNASSGGGAGAGLGGAIFVYSGNVSIDLCDLQENGATGGTATGLVAQHTGGGGGGGLLGSGGLGAGSNEITGGNAIAVGIFGGGGGGGNSYTSETGGGNGGNGGGSFAGSGGTLFPVVPPSAGGFGGGGGGGAAPGNAASQAGASGGFGGGGGGGAGSGMAFNVDTPGSGANGGFGGGGGAGGSANAAQGAAGGDGGFGGGGGSSGTGSFSGFPGLGGFGGGDASTSSGGGGAAFGGALFVRSGVVHVTNSQVQGNFNKRGTGPGGNGLAKGAGIFALASATNTNDNQQGMPAQLPSVTGCGVTFGSNTADDPGTSNVDNVDVYGVDRLGLTLACGDRVFADGFGLF